MYRTGTLAQIQWLCVYVCVYVCCVCGVCVCVCVYCDKCEHI